MSQNRICIFPKCSYKGATGLYKFPIKDKDRLDLQLMKEKMVFISKKVLFHMAPVV